VAAESHDDTQQDAPRLLSVFGCGYAAAATAHKRSAAACRTGSATTSPPPARLATPTLPSSPPGLTLTKMRSHACCALALAAIVLAVAAPLAAARQLPGRFRIFGTSTAR
jgi:hypothetical protein